MMQLGGNPAAHVWQLFSNRRTCRLRHSRPPFWSEELPHEKPVSGWNIAAFEPCFRPALRGGPGLFVVHGAAGRLNARGIGNVDLLGTRRARVSGKGQPGGIFRAGRKGFVSSCTPKFLVNGIEFFPVAGLQGPIQVGDPASEGLRLVVLCRRGGRRKLLSQITYVGQSNRGFA